MKKSERQRLVLLEVQNATPDEILSTRSLAGQFEVSEATIRRDLQELSHAGLIDRLYGGAQLRKTRAATGQGQVGVLLLSRVNKYRDPYYNLVLEGADKALGRLGYGIAFVKTFHEISTTAQVKQLLESFPVKGMIVRGISDVESVAYLRERFSPIVTVANHRHLDDDLILFDGEQGMRQLVAHLAKLGHRRLAYIAGYEDVRYAGFCQGLAAFELPRDTRLHQIIEPGPSGWTPDLGERGAQILMNQSPKPDAIVCASDRLAIGAMAWLQRNGCRVPDDIAVTGFDNIPDSQFTFPPLTTVHVHKVRLGELAAERLVKRIEYPDDVYLKIITPTHLVLRQSCGASP